MKPTPCHSDPAKPERNLPPTSIILLGRLPRPPTFVGVLAMTEKLAIRISNINMNNNLDIWRQQIDRLDRKILDLLASRRDIVKKIGQYKEEHHLAVLDKKRWQEMLKLNLARAKSLNLSPTVVKKILTLIHQYSVKLQKEL